MPGSVLMRVTGMLVGHTRDPEYQTL